MARLGRTYARVIIKTRSRFSLVSLNETLSLTDTALKTTVRTFIESITHTDTLLKTPIKVFIEAITFTDSIVRTVARTLTEAITFTDTVLKTASRTFTEAITLTATLVRNPIKIFLEVITFRDMVWQKFLRGVTSWTKQNQNSGGFTKQTPTSATWNQERGQGHD